MSVTKFVEYIKKTKRLNVNEATLYFQAKDTFTNRFGNACIKPVYIILQGYSDKKYITHETIMNDLGGLIISFTESKTKTLPPTNEDNLYTMTIEFTQKMYNGIQYYPVKVSKEPDNNTEVAKQIVQ